MNIQGYRTKPQQPLKLRIEVLCGIERTAWVNPFLIGGILGLRTESIKTEISFSIDQRPVEFARNTAAASALRTGADWLLMADNDQVITQNFSALVQEANTNPAVDVVCGYSWIVKGRLVANVWQDARSLIPERLILEDNPGFQEIEQGGSGVILIRRKVLETVPAPWFHTPLNSQTGEIVDGEDAYFCKKAREHGFRIHTHAHFPCDHLKTVSLRSVAEALAGTRSDWGIDMRGYSG